MRPWQAALAAAERRGYEHALAEALLHAPDGDAGAARNVGELVAGIVRAVRLAEQQQVAVGVPAAGESGGSGLLVATVGAAGSGKSTWCRATYAAGEVLSRDRLRAAVSGDECDRAATADADAVLQVLAAARLRRGLRVVVDSTGTDRRLRAALAELAAGLGARRELVVVDTPLEVCLRRNSARPGPLAGRRWGRQVPEQTVRAQHAEAIAVLRTARHLGCLGRQVAEADWRPDIAGWDQVAVLDRDTGVPVLVTATQPWPAARTAGAS